MRQRHHVLLARVALGLLALVAELGGRSLTYRIDIGRHVAPPSYSGADYYPILLIVVKVAVALMLARLVWRFAKARATARAARRLLRARGELSRPRAPRVRLEISPKLWLVAFLVTSVFFLIQTDAEQISTGRWPLLAPWLHTSALPVFAVLAGGKDDKEKDKDKPPPGGTRAPRPALPIRSRVREQTASRAGLARGPVVRGHGP